MIAVMNRNERIPIDSDLLATFVQIARCGNLTLAAGQLGRTQSAISVQLRKLEDGLGTTLFFRSTRGMRLTPAGETLLSRATGILDDLRDAAGLFREPLVGSIRVGLPDDFDETALERILASFSRAHPGVQVLAQSGCTAGYPAAVKAGALDVAVCSSLNALEGDPLSMDQIVWASRQSDGWPARGIVPLAVLDRACYWRDLPVKLLDQSGVKHRVAFQSSSFTSLQAALRSGIAVGLLPRSCMNDGLAILTEADGFPKPPAAHRVIQVSDAASQPIASAMVEAIRSV